jgi:hypothetical protein
MEMSENKNVLRKDTKSNIRVYTTLNCLSSALLAYFFTVPFHEFLHFVTFYIYGHKVEYFSAGSVGPVYLYDLHELPPFHRIMAAGGSASITNAILGVVLFILLIKIRNIPSMLRLFLTQLMGGQLLEGFGYFLIGGYFQAGDWGNVFSYFDSPGTIAVMRIILAVIGTVSPVLILYISINMTYYFIQNPSDKAERKRVSAGINLILFLASYIVGGLACINLPEVRNGELPYWLFLIYNGMWFLYLVTFFYAWGGIMVKPPTESVFRCSLPKKPYPIIWGLAIVLTLIDIFVFGPGVYL